MVVSLLEMSIKNDDANGVADILANHGAWYANASAITYTRNPLIIVAGCYGRLVFPTILRLDTRRRERDCSSSF